MDIRHVFYLHTLIDFCISDRYAMTYYNDVCAAAVVEECAGMLN